MAYPSNYTDSVRSLIVNLGMESPPPSPPKLLRISPPSETPESEADYDPATDSLPEWNKMPRPGRLPDLRHIKPSRRCAALQLLFAEHHDRPPFLTADSCFMTKETQHDAQREPKSKLEPQPKPTQESQHSTSPTPVLLVTSALAPTVIKVPDSAPVPTAQPQRDAHRELQRKLDREAQHDLQRQVQRGLRRELEHNLQRALQHEPKSNPESKAEHSKAPTPVLLGSPAPAPAVTKFPASAPVPTTQTQSNSQHKPEPEPKSEPELRAAHRANPMLVLLATPAPASAITKAPASASVVTKLPASAPVVDALPSWHQSCTDYATQEPEVFHLPNLRPTEWTMKLILIWIRCFFAIQFALGVLKEGHESTKVTRFCGCAFLVLQLGVFIPPIVDYYLSHPPSVRELGPLVKQARRHCIAFKTYLIPALTFGIGYYIGIRG
ncbi:hypothetical protein CspeluHIS016_0902990 [Cutaneotrichosporon spelunceum]|uniref:Uncharacterized protein n=1 Tax=Cutaneotrichosporon spelunceum TaxID=1672016 RepID=A0AAD3YFK3_9TREE|nr:hypothetical protein CspeluHIS016_0902990 [Cutaneotrichosporon spelunceum]